MTDDRRINVNIIRIYEGPIHSKLEAIWKWYAKQHADRMSLHVFDNTKLQLPHDKAYARMWELESRRIEDYTIFTEFDFLPGADFLKVYPNSMWAAQYCTREPHTKALQRHPHPGAWYVAANKNNCDVPNFASGGPFNDPCNELECEYLDTEDCYPDHYGVKVQLEAITKYTPGPLYDIGTHLFWSRHYNDPPGAYVAGFHIKPILEGVDRAITNWLAA